MVQNAYHIRSALLALAPTVDLTGVVSTLESHWVVLDAELSEIRKDFAVLRALTRKHGWQVDCHAISAREHMTPARIAPLV